VRDGAHRSRSLRDVCALVRSREATRATQTMQTRGDRNAALAARSLLLENDMASRTNEPKNPRILLQTDHRDIDDRLARIVMLLRADDRPAALRAWRSLEEAMLAHLDVEEMYVLPLLEETDVNEVRGLRAEHDAFRRMLGELGLAFELHTIRAEMFDAFAERLDAHAEREESLLYRNAESRMQVSVARQIVRRLRGALGRSREQRASRARRTEATRIA
jgi:hypothetical protein